MRTLQRIVVSSVSSLYLERNIKIEFQGRLCGVPGFYGKGGGTGPDPKEREKGGKQNIGQ